MAARADLVVYEGDDYNAQVKVSNGLPPSQVLAGYTAQAQIRAGPANSNPDILVTIACTVDSPYINLSIPHDQATSDLIIPGTLAQWDLQITAADGTITTLLAGNVQLIQEVTR